MGADTVNELQETNRLLGEILEALRGGLNTTSTARPSETKPSARAKEVK